MTKRRRRLLIALGACSAVVLAVWGAVVLLVPRLVGGALEEAATRALGREVRLGAPVEVALSFPPRITARGLTLANAPWGSEPTMVRIARATVAVELASLWKGPLRVRELSIEGVRVLLEGDGAGGGNWVLALPGGPAAPAQPGAPPPVLIERVELRDLEVTYRARPGDTALQATVAALDARLEPEGQRVALRADGRLEALPWALDGAIGPYAALFHGAGLDGALTGRLGAVALAVRGQLREPLATSELDLSAEGPDLAAAARALQLGALPQGPFRVRTFLRPTQEGLAAEVEATLAGVSGKLRGALPRPAGEGALRVAAEIDGPDASVVGGWLGVNGIPRRPFALSAQVRREAGRLLLDEVSARLDRDTVVVAGVLGAPPRFEGTDVAIRMRGPDLSRVAPRRRLRVPQGPFALSGQLRRGPDGLVLRGAELRVRGATLRLDGILGEPPALAGLALSLHASGPDLAVFSALAGRPLPRAPFALSGRVAREGAALRLQRVKGRLGEVTLDAEGRVMLARGLSGTALAVRAAGHDLAWLAGPLGLAGLPAQPFTVSGGVRVEPGGYALEGVEATVGPLHARAEGRLGAGLRGTALDCRLGGPALSALAAWGVPGALPPEPFVVAGRLRVDEAGVVHLDQAAVDAGRDRLAVDGALGALPDTSGLDVAVEGAGPSLAALRRFFPSARLPAARRLPAAAYSLTGRVHRVETGFALDDVRARVAELSAHVGGVIGTGESLAGTDLRFEVEGSGAGLLAEVAGAGLPAGALDAHGRVARNGAGLLLDGVAISIGPAHAELSGTLGAGAGALRATAAGPDLAAALRPAWPGVRLPAAPFELSADLSWTRDRLEAAALEARVGDSRVEGTASLRRSARPLVEADLRSPRLDLDELLAQPGAPEAAAPPPGRPARDRLIPDRPVALPALPFDARLGLRVEALRAAGLDLRDVSVDGALQGGALRLDRLEGTSEGLGRLTAHLELAPAGHALRVEARGELDGFRLVASRTAPAPADAPPLRAEFKLRGEGASVRALAATLDGTVQVTVKSGRIANPYERMTTGVVPGLLDALNPARKSSGETRVECGIALATVRGGKAAVAPLAARTDQLTVVGTGRVDLATEALELEWTLKPRTGGGISVGSIANPYVKLGGTLAAPKLEVKPVQAVASTGAAVATLGLTVLARGFYDRITAERNVCLDALVQEGQAGEQ
jgi:uncharacterized protein involved in outer membrane biogenesis